MGCTPVSLGSVAAAYGIDVGTPHERSGTMDGLGMVVSLFIFTNAWQWHFQKNLGVNALVTRKTR